MHFHVHFPISCHKNYRVSGIVEDLTNHIYFFVAEGVLSAVSKDFSVSPTHFQLEPIRNQYTYCLLVF